MLFENNAKIANRYFETPLGILKEGAAADVVIMDYKNYTELSDKNINGHILFGMNGGHVNTTVCNGEVLMRDRKLTKIDEESAYAKIKE